MRAIVHNAYGSPDVLELQEIEQPDLTDDGVLVRVRATSVNPAEWYGLTGRPYVARAQSGLRKPKSNRLGVDFAGTVEAVGKDVTQFRPGDEVFGGRSGAFAEYVCVPEDRAVVPKPANVTFEQAAGVGVAGLTALQGLRDKGQIQPGQQVLINGASGGVGTFAVQIAKAFGAEVTGVCSTRNVDLVRSLGADHVIDYTQQDFADGATRYDLILDIGGNSSLSRLRRALTPHGTLVIAGGEEGGRWIGGNDRQLRALALSPFVGQRLTTFVSKEHYTGLERLTEFIEDGQLVPVIEQTYPLSDMPKAMRHLQSGRARGKLVIAVSSGRDTAGGSTERENERTR